jgi:hypothetical protein
MRPPSHNRDGGLDLLLDAMCNAFGGIMFIALLLVILSQLTEVRPIGAQTRAQLAEHTSALEILELETQLDQLQTSEAHQRKLLQALASDESRSNVARLRSNRAAMTDAQRDLDKARGETSAAFKREQMTREQIKKIDVTVKKVLEKIRETREVIEEAKRKQKREYRMPRLRRSRKMTFWLIVKSDRLFILDDPLTGEPTRDVIRQVIDEDRVLYAPKAAHGVDLTKDWTADSRIGSMLRHVSPRRKGLHFAVYPDSYDAFLVVRNFFVLKQYDFNWVPMSGPDDPLILVNSTSVNVQN